MDWIVIESVIAFMIIVVATAYIAYRAGNSNGRRTGVARAVVTLDDLILHRVTAYRTMSDKVKAETLNAHEHRAFCMGIIDAKNALAESLVVVQPSYDYESLHP